MELYDIAVVSVSSEDNDLHVLKIVVSKIVEGFKNIYRLPKNYAKTYFPAIIQDMQIKHFHKVTLFWTAKTPEVTEIFSLGWYVQNLHANIPIPS